MSLKERIEKNAVVWFLGTLLTGFIAGIGSYEFVTRAAGLTHVSKSEADARVKETEDLKAKVAVQNKQVRFLSLYLRYALANLEPFKFKEEYSKNEPEFRRVLDDYILKFIDDSEKTESTVAVGKGHGTQVTVTFPDGTKWDVPPGFRAATAD